MAVAAAGGGPVIGAACVATVAGFAVFALSPSPLVRSFGLLLVIGSRARVPGRAHRRAWRRSASPPGADSAPAAAPRRRAAVAGVGRPPAGPPASRRSPSRSPARGACWRPVSLLAVCGWIASAGTGVETDIRDLAPPNLAALKDLNELEKETGISGDVNVTIQGAGPDRARP